MAQNQFKVGNVVQLKSGGPMMTVRLADFPDAIHCAWFVGGEPKEYKGVFHADMLTAYSDPVLPYVG